MPAVCTLLNQPSPSGCPGYLSCRGPSHAIKQFGRLFCGVVVQIREHDPHLAHLILVMVYDKADGDLKRLVTR